MQESAPRFFDVHTHVQFVAFKDDYKEAIERALEAGVWMINVGTQKDTSKRAIEIAHEYKEGVYATVGIHPIHTSKSFHDAEELGPSASSGQADGETAKSFTSRGEDFDYDYYKKLALDPKVVAIGECGLDYFRITDEEAKRRQKESFLKQIELAKEVKKPLMIHCRAERDIDPAKRGVGNAFKDLIEILKPNTSHLKPSIIHFFTGTKDEARKLLDLGFSFTFGGVITFPSRLAERSRGEAGTKDYDEVIRMIPMDRILSETDAPYVAPVPYRGKRNEPAYVVEVVKKLAEIKGVTAGEMAEQILRNTQRVLCIS